MSVATLKRRISTGGDSKLRAVHLKQTPEPPSAADVITRNKPPLELTEAELAEQIRKQDIILFRDGLKKAGVREDTLQCLEILDGLSKNSGRFLVNSLDLSHRMMVYLNIQLLERANDIKKDYLEDETLDDEYKIEWQKAYNEIVDIIRKSYESTLVGTQAMAKIMVAAGGKKKDDDGGKKPGFSPLRASSRK